MPQMSPLYWFILYFYFIIFMIIIMTMIFNLLDKKIFYSKKFKLVKWFNKW